MGVNVDFVMGKAGLQRAAGHICAVLKGVLFIGISIQTILGIVWMCCNFLHFPQYGESLFYMRVSRTLHCDEYTGILYPAFLRIAGGNHSVVYGAQLIAAFVSARRFLGTVLPWKGWRMTWGCLALLTLPTVMQCHMAVLPYSFAASLLLTGLSVLAEAVKREEKRTLARLAKLCLCWLALAFLLPEYLYLGAVPVVLFVLCCRRRLMGNKRSVGYSVLLIAAFLGIITGVNSLTQTQGMYGRVHKTSLMALTQRFAWTSLMEEYGNWYGELAGFIDPYTMAESVMYADGMDSFFFPAMERALAEGAITPGEAKAHYRTIIATAWKWHKPEILKEMMWDVVGYGASPAVIQLLLNGRGYDSYTNRNYDFFLEGTPRLSKRYMDYGCWWFGAMLALTAALGILRLAGGAWTVRGEGVRLVLCCFIMAGVMVLWYTLRGAGMMDYKCTAAVPQLWTACAAALLLSPGTAGQDSE